VTVNRTG